MFVSNPSPSVTSQQLVAVSGAIDQTINTVSLSGNPQQVVMLSVTIPTGVASVYVPYSLSYSGCPQLSWSLWAPAGVVYQVNPSSVGLSGYWVSFSDTILETGLILTTVLKPVSL